jgi:hypothetical protein
MGSKLASAATKSTDVQIACSHLVLLNRDGNLSTKDLANALAAFVQKCPKVHWARSLALGDIAVRDFRC